MTPNECAFGFLSQKQAVCVGVEVEVLRIVRQSLGQRRGQNIKGWPILLFSDVCVGWGKGEKMLDPCLEALELGLGEGKQRASGPLLRSVSSLQDL